MGLLCRCAERRGGWGCCVVSGLRSEEGCGYLRVTAGVRPVVSGRSSVLHQRKDLRVGSRVLDESSLVEVSPEWVSLLVLLVCSGKGLLWRV